LLPPLFAHKADFLRNHLRTPPATEEAEETEDIVPEDEYTPEELAN